LTFFQDYATILAEIWHNNNQYLTGTVKLPENGLRMDPEEEMIAKRLGIILGIILAVVVLGACVRSASTPPTSLPTPTSGVEGEKGAEVAAPTNEVIQQLELFVTQTAAASQGAGGEIPTPEGGMGLPADTPGAGEAPVTEGTPGTEAGQPAPTTETGQLAPTSEPSQPAETVPTSEPVQGANPTPVQIVVPTATPGIPKTYVIQAGEFPFCIARRFDLNPIELLSLNGLGSGSIVRPGTELRIPQTGNHFPSNRSLQPHPTTYIVKSGDTIYTIACAFGEVSPDAIVFANGLTGNYQLTAGQQLYIP